ncbi:MAG: glycosyltransferase family 2 protein [Chloroflexota bacterium]
MPDSDAPRPPSVDYVVVAFRSERHLGPCLDAIEADRPPHSSVIVVDNASPDGSAELARGHPTRPRLLDSGRNLGFGGGCNLGARASSADLLFFVNPDARLRPGATTRLAAAIWGEAQVAVAGPRISDSGGTLRAASAGHEPTLRSILGHFVFFARIPGLGRFFPPLQLPNGAPAQSVDWVGGAALMVRNDAFMSVDGFDESIFLYMEDVDLCRRLRAAHWLVRYVPSASADHDLGGSQGAEQADRWYLAFHAYLVRHHGAQYARLASAVSAIGLAMRAALIIVSRPRHGRRLARAARTALGLAVGTLSPDGASGGT